MRFGERVIAAAFSLFGLYIIFASLHLNAGAGYGLGPGFFPFWLGIAIVLCGTAVLFQSFRRSEPSGEPLARAAVTKRWLVAAVLLAFVSASGLCGFVVAFSLLVAFLLFCIEREPWWRAALISLATGFGFHVFFVRLLEVQLPTGPWGF